ncbi:carbohydrate porin [Puniceicoccus vermicola]|uniref:Carbohydrate porin n=1 Tax=Puniceicoccus vermicola TaxID=388746 RepID=A0A7X1AZQ1_9BACT|nr:carbohydrate porin [Puniceicoccus vermicola]MBC2602894.1 carbohydrate porin [Puniceicoccus vermicola]
MNAKPTCSLILSALLLAASASMGYENYDPYEDEPYSDRLTGDWGGYRSKLVDEGVEVFAYFNAIYAGNVSGGLEKTSDFASDSFFGAEFDLEKLIGWEDTEFVVSGIYRQGDDLTEAIGSQYSVMQLVGGQTIFLYNVTLEKLFRDGDISVKGGRMTATDDFVGSPYYGYSLNNAVNGQIRAVLFDGVMTSYPYAVWGGRVRVNLPQDSKVQVGVFQLSPDMFDPDKHGVDLNIGSDDGVSIFTQYDWTPELAGKPFRFYAGVNQTFGYDIDEFNSDSTTDAFTRFYMGTDYQVYREREESDEGLVLLATFAYTAQQEVAIVPIQSSVGANYKGLLPGRPDDQAVLFFTYGQFSDDYSDQLVAAGGASVDNEMVLETGYRVAITDYIYAQPDVQYIINPGGTGDIDNAVVLGVQFGARF